MIKNHYKNILAGVVWFFVVILTPAKMYALEPAPDDLEEKLMEAIIKARPKQASSMKSSSDRKEERQERWERQLKYQEEKRRREEEEQRIRTEAAKEAAKSNIDNERSWAPRIERRMVEDRRQAHESWSRSRSEDNSRLSRREEYQQTQNSNRARITRNRKERNKTSVSADYIQIANSLSPNYPSLSEMVNIWNEQWKNTLKSRGRSKYFGLVKGRIGKTPMGMQWLNVYNTLDRGANIKNIVLTMANYQLNAIRLSSYSGDPRWVDYAQRESLIETYKLSGEVGVPQLPVNFKEFSFEVQKWIIHYNMLGMMELLGMPLL